jgi:hypothetical protein
MFLPIQNGYQIVELPNRFYLIFKRCLGTLSWINCYLVEIECSEQIGRPKVVCTQIFFPFFATNLKYSLKRHDLQTWHRLQHRVHPLLKVDFIQKVRFIFQISKSSIKNIPNYKADLLQLKLTPIICLMNFIKKKVGM